MGHAEEFFRNPSYAEYWSDKIREQKYEEPYRKDFLQALKASSGDLVLEVGVGEGRNLLDLISTGAGYVGIDISLAMLRKTRQRIPEPNSKNCDLVLADAMWIPFRARSFDKALSFATIFFVPDQATAIREIHSVAKRRIAIEFRNSRNPKVFLYGKMSALTVVAQPLLRVLLKRNSVRSALAFVLGKSRAEKFSKQISVYGSLQPVFGVTVATITKEITKNGWRTESIQAYPMVDPGQSFDAQDLRAGRYNPVLVAHSVRDANANALEIDTRA